MELAVIDVHRHEAPPASLGVRVGVALAVWKSLVGTARSLREVQVAPDVGSAFSLTGDGRVVWGALTVTRRALHAAALTSS
jgi:hypothetical protein